MTTLETTPQSHRLRRAVLIALLIAGGAYFTLRGPCRGWSHSIDWNVFYSASRAWLEGTNPYDAQNLHRVFTQAGGDRQPTYSLNPPPTFPVLAPFALLPWSWAQPAFAALNVALVAGCIVAMLSWMGLRGTDRGIAFTAFAFALAPFHTSISQGQLTIPVTALVLLALFCEWRSRPIVAGILIGLATALKPQMGVVLVLMLLLRMRWTAAISAMATVAALSGVAVGRMLAAGVDWLPGLQHNIAEFTSIGTGNPAVQNSQRCLMVNLAVVLHSFIDSAFAVDILLAVLLIAAAVALIAALRNTRGLHSELIAYSGFTIITLLAFYNRVYSATLLVLPLAWAMWALTQQRLRRIALGVLLLILPFVVPGAAALNHFRHSLPQNLVESWAWNNLILLHQNYALAGLLILVILAAKKLEKTGPTQLQLAAPPEINATPDNP